MAETEPQASPITQGMLSVYHSCFDNSPVASCVIKVLQDRTGKVCDFSFVYLNRALAVLEGRSIQSLQGRRFFQLFKNADKKWLRIYGDAAFSGTRGVFVEYSPEIAKFIKIDCFQIRKGYCGCFLWDETDIKRTTAMLHTQMQYCAAIDAQETDVWEYDIAKRCSVYSRKSSFGFSRLAEDGTLTVRNVPESLLSYSCSMKDAAMHMKIYERIWAGEPFAVSSFCFRLKKDEPPVCEQIFYTVAFDSDGKPVKAYGIGRKLRMPEGKGEDKGRKVYTL